MCKYIKTYIYLKNISKNIHNITKYVTKNDKNTNPFAVCDCLPIYYNKSLFINYSYSRFCITSIH